MNTKTNIKSFGKTFQYLNDTELRRKETSDSTLIIKGAQFSGVKFEGQTWRNLKFLDCDFVGGYEIKLQAMENCAFEGCKIVGIHDFGDMNKVRFYKCLSASDSNWGGQTNSKDVSFEECQFVGSSSDRNHQGAIGTYGEAVFINCKIKWFEVIGDTRLTLTGCELEDVAYRPSSERDGAHVLIENSKLHGKFDMVSAMLLSLTIRDTVIDNIDLSQATVKGDVLIDRCKGGTINAGVRSARSFTIRNSQILGPGEATFVMAMDSADHVLLDTVRFGTGLTTKVNLGPGRPLKENEWNAVPTNKAAVIRNCTLPIVNASWLETLQLTLDGNTIGSLDLSNSRIDKLELSGNTIARSVDFSNTQAKESRVQPLAKGQAKLDGSNIKA